MITANIIIMPIINDFSTSRLPISLSGEFSSTCLAITRSRTLLCCHIRDLVEVPGSFEQQNIILFEIEDTCKHMKTELSLTAKKKTKLKNCIKYFPDYVALILDEEP